MMMQDLRSLVTKWSTMSIYRREETFDLSQSVVGFLLEGSVKRVGGHDEWFSCPAALTPCDGDPTFELSETSGAGSHVLSYRVETKARVMLLNLADYEANRISTLQERSLSMLSPSLNHPAANISDSTMNSGRLPANNISYRTSRLSHSRSFPGVTPPYAQPIIRSSPMIHKTFSGVHQEGTTVDSLISISRGKEEGDSSERWSGEKAEPSGDSSSTPSFLQPLLKN